MAAAAEVAVVLISHLLLFPSKSAKLGFSDFRDNIAGMLMLARSEWQKPSKSYLERKDEFILT